jgi:hypothetical protein
MRRLAIIPLLCLLTLHLPTSAAESLKGVSIRIFAVALCNNQGPVCVIAGETRSEPFDIPTTNLSLPQTVQARDFILVSATSPPDAPPVPLANIHLPDQGSDYRIMLIPASSNSYKPVVIRGDDPKFSRGDFFFINLSNAEILGALGTSRLDLKPGAQTIITPTGATDKFFEVKFARREVDKLMPLTNTCWPIVRDNRSFVIFYNGSNGRPTYRAVDEFMALATAKN